MPLLLSPLQHSPIPTEIRGITPDRLAGLSIPEIERLPVLHGNRSLPLAELFHVAGSAQDLHLELHGDLSCVHWVGAGMTGGRIHVEGSVGRHAGSGMSGGQLEIAGSADGWAGAEMRGGLLRIKGSAGPLAGGAYRGATKGMTGGNLLIHGDAGSETGLVMRRGLIAIGGSCGDFPAFNMLAGALFVFGSCGRRPAAGMRRGTLAMLGHAPSNPPLPTFRYSATLQPTALRLVLTRLEQLQFPFNHDLFHACVDMYRGDLVAGGKGELLKIPEAAFPR